MIQLSELTKSFGDRVLFDHVTWQITDRERVGLCGPNGAGKTTLLKMLAGLDEPDAGGILKPAAVRVGYLPQDGLEHSGRSVFEEASSAFDELLAMKAEMHALEQRLGDQSIPEAEHDTMLHRYSDLQDRFRLHDGYSIELKTATVLQGLGFKASDFERPTETFSGGWQMRIALAKLLEKVVPIEVPPERKKIHFDFPPCARSGRMVLELKHARKAYGDLVVFRDLELHIERGDRIALVGPNGAGKSTLMRMLSGEEPPDSGRRAEGHHVVKEYFAQDEATRLDPGLTVYETLASGSPLHMVPAIRSILGGFLFSGDDVYKKVAVLSGGERTRLAVARMLLRPSNTLLLDEPTNHLDLDSKEVLLDALVDYGGTLIFVSHDRYFVERLATKIIEVGNGEAIVYPGTYAEFLYRKEHPEDVVPPHAVGRAFQASRQNASPVRSRERLALRESEKRAPQKLADHQKTQTRDEKKRVDAEARKRHRAEQARQAEITALETRIAECEAGIREIEQTMAAPGFYEDRAAAQPVIDRHQTLMWQVGDLMHQWEALQSQADLAKEA